MDNQETRLGDLIDDYCPRCRHLLNHAVASMVGAQVAKVICQTCYTEHAYRHGEAGKKKTNPRATLFDQVLGNLSAGDEPEGEPEDSPKPAAKSRTTKRRKAAPARSKDKSTD